MRLATGRTFPRCVANSQCRVRKHTVHASACFDTSWCGLSGLSQPADCFDGCNRTPMTWGRRARIVCCGNNPGGANLESLQAGLSVARSGHLGTKALILGLQVLRVLVVGQGPLRRLQLAIRKSKWRRLQISWMTQSWSW